MRPNALALLFSLLLWHEALPGQARHGADAGAPGRGAVVDWPVYGGDAADDHYSALKQINRANAKDLRGRVDV